MAGIVGGSLGPGSPQPVSYGYRQPTLGKPSVSYQPQAGQLQTTVGQGQGGTALSATFQPRPPVRPPGGGGVGERGSFVDTHA